MKYVTRQSDSSFCKLYTLLTLFVAKFHLLLTLAGEFWLCEHYMEPGQVEFNHFCSSKNSAEFWYALISQPIRIFEKKLKER